MKDGPEVDAIFDIERLEREENLRAENRRLRPHALLVRFVSASEWVLVVLCFLSVAYSPIGKIARILAREPPFFWDANGAMIFGLAAGMGYSLVVLVNLWIYPRYKRLYRETSTAIDQKTAIDGYETLSDESKKTVAMFWALIQPKLFEGRRGLKLNILLGICTATIAVFFATIG